MTRKSSERSQNANSIAISAVTIGELVLYRRQGSVSQFQGSLGLEVKKHVQFVLMIRDNTHGAAAIGRG